MRVVEDDKDAATAVKEVTELLQKEGWVVDAQSANAAEWDDDDDDNE